MTDLHRQLVTQHKTIRYETSEGSISIRREQGTYVVRFWDRVEHKRSKTVYKTLEGAQIAVEMVRRAYL